MQKLLPILVAALLGLLPAHPARALDASMSAADMAVLRKWVTRQSEVRTVQADFMQTRTFHALRDPLAAPGRLWFSAKDGFRWEIGDPPKTVILKKGNTSLAIEPAKKRAEPLNGAGSEAPGVGMNPLSMMSFPLAKNFDDFNRQFEVLGVSLAGDRCHVELMPRDPAARKYLSAFRLDFDTDDGHLLDFEIALRDGSSLRNEFSNVRLNGNIDARVFDYDLTGYEVTDGRR